MGEDYLDRLEKRMAAIEDRIIHGIEPTVGDLKRQVRELQDKLSQMLLSKSK